MDKQFEQMLLDAEKIRSECRRSGNIGPHAKQMAKMMKYATEKKLISGNILDGTANNELICDTAEMAACLLEVIYGEEIGPVFFLPLERKFEIIKRAKEKAEAKIKLPGHLGLK